MRRKPFTSPMMFLRETENISETDEAVLPVEKTYGPLLLISGKDDQR